MAISRKGMRKIVVDGGTYYYKIRRASSWHDCVLTVIIEAPDGKVYTEKIKRDSYYNAFTPKDTAELIRSLNRGV